MGKNHHATSSPHATRPFLASDIDFSMNMAAQRIVHLTFHKCGSQWVRDVLTHPAMQPHTGILPLNESYSLSVQSWPEQPENTFLGPLYNASPLDWEANRQPTDRAIVVLRDPRDRLISWMFSVTYSHISGKGINFWRELLMPMTNRCRILLGILEFRGIAPLFDQWAREKSSEHTYITTYETLVKDGIGEFQKIVQFLGWNVPEKALQDAVKSLSFEKRSGRERGEENVHSHYRKGVAGDWRSYFDRETGALWEQRMPGLLTHLGYETDCEWYNSLPERAEAESEGAISDPALDIQAASMKAELVRVQETITPYVALIKEQKEKAQQDKLQRRYLKDRLKRVKRLMRKLEKKKVIRCLRWMGKMRHKLLNSFGR